MHRRIILLFNLLFLTSVYLKSQIVNIEDKRIRLGDSITFKGFVDLGFNVFKNDKTLMTAKATGQIEKLAFKKHFFLFIGGYNFAKAEGQNFLNDGFLHLRYNYWIQRSLVLEIFTQAQYNERTNILFRGLVGSGLRFKFKSAEKNRFYLGLAYMFEQNQYNRDLIPDQNNHRLSSYFSYNLSLTNNSRFIHTTYFQPLLNNFSNNRVSSDATLLFNFTKHLVFRASFNTSYDNDARLPESIPDLIYTWTNGLRWDF
jgi:Protein of unknown function, DUF481